MDAIDLLFWATVIWTPSLVLMAYLMIPSQRRHNDLD